MDTFNSTDSLYKNVSFSYTQNKKELCDKGTHVISGVAALSIEDNYLVAENQCILCGKIIKKLKVKGELIECD